MPDIINLNFGWSYINYGAVLTGYALSKALEKLGYSSELLYEEEKYLSGFQKKNNKLKLFHENTKMHKLKQGESLYDLNDSAKVFMTGSDQVFRIAELKERSSMYLLDFVNPRNKKIAFSASFGVNKEDFLSETSEKEREQMKNSLKTFDFVSVREKSGVEICGDLFGIKAECVVDPVFLIEKSNYEKTAGNADIDYHNKITAYVLDTNSEFKKACKYLSEKYKKEVVETANSNITIENWLASIKNCDLFITDSFHGMCFAIIFNKPFICLANKSRGQTRFESILETLEIENACISSASEIIHKDCIFKINYDEVNKKIEEERQHAINMLKQALEVPIDNSEEKTNARIQYAEGLLRKAEVQNNLSYQLKKYLKDKLLLLYYGYLPNFAKSVIRLCRHAIKRGK